MLELIFHFFVHIYADTMRVQRQVSAQLLAQMERIQWHRSALKKADAENDPHAEVAALIQLGNQHSSLEEAQTSIMLYQRARATAHATGDPSLEMTALINLAACYSALGNFTDSYAYYKQALEIARKAGSGDFEKTILQQIDQLYYAIKADELSKPSH